MGRIPPPPPRYVETRADSASRCSCSLMLAVAMYSGLAAAPLVVNAAALAVVRQYKVLLPGAEYACWLAGGQASKPIGPSEAQAEMQQCSHERPYTFHLTNLVKPGSLFAGR